MCGRFTLKSPPQKIAEQFQLDLLPDWQPRYNLAPTQSALVVRASENNEAQVRREAVPMHWGLIPPWADDRKIGSQLINARSETAATKPTFRHAFKKRRCLIPSDGFYEWQKAGKLKQPYYIGLADGGLMAFAGLWERWGKGEESIESCTILTTSANEVLRPLHDRMPVILSPRDYELWLDPRVQSADELSHMLATYPGEAMRAWPVSREMNKPSFDNPACVKRLEEPGMLF